MAWYKVDDGFHSSHKVLSIPRMVRLQAVGLWTLAGAWSADQELDGFVPDFMVTELGGTPRLVGALVKAGLWDESPAGGFQYRNWAEYQPTRADLDAQRSKDAERKRKWRESQRPADVPPGQVADSQQDTNRSPSTPSRPVPTRPDPALLTDSSNTDQSCPEGDTGAGDKTDIKVAPLIADLKHHADIEATETEAVAWAEYVAAHAKTAVRDRTSYALTALYNGPSEVTTWFRQHRREGKARVA